MLIAAIAHPDQGLFIVPRWGEVHMSLTNSSISGKDYIKTLFSDQSHSLRSCTFSKSNVAIDLASIHANF